MSKNTENEKELLARLEASLDSDVLDPDAYSSEDVDDSLRLAGGDPKAIGELGASLAKELLKQRRLAWQEMAKQRIAGRAAIVHRSRDLKKFRKAELLHRWEELKGDPRFETHVSAAFRSRQPETASEEELRALIEEIELLLLLKQSSDTEDSQ